MVETTPPWPGQLWAHYLPRYRLTKAIYGFYLMVWALPWTARFLSKLS